MVCSAELLLLWLSLGRVTTMMPVLGCALHLMVEQGIQNRYSGDPSELKSRNFTAGGCAHQIRVVHSWLASLVLHGLMWPHVRCSTAQEAFHRSSLSQHLWG